MKQRTFIVDSNFLRAPELARLVTDRAGYLFVVPDLVMFEAAKSTNRELTLRSSLRILSTIPERVFIGRSVSDLLRSEIHGQQPLQHPGDCVNLEATPVFRQILQAVRDNGTNEVWQEVIDDPTEYLPSLSLDHLSHADNKARAIKFQIEGVEPDFTPAFLRRLRNDEVGYAERLFVTFDRAAKIAFDVMHGQYGFSEDIALRMINAKCIILRHCVVRYWMALQTSIRAEFKSRPAAQVSNDNIDAHNVIIATQLGRLLTNDERSLDTFTASTQLLSVPIRYGIERHDGRRVIAPK